MQHIHAKCTESFHCPPGECPAPCSLACPTWTNTLGDICETGLSMACPQAAGHMLLSTTPMGFTTRRGDEAPADFHSLTREQLSLILDARRTLDIVLQNRSLEFRSDVVQALTYTSEFDPMITSDARYAYEELDWGYTEQPYRMLGGLVQLQGFWPEKQQDLIAVLEDMRPIAVGDSLLGEHFDKTITFFRSLSPEECKTRRDSFDRYMTPREYMFENLLVYLVHRHFLDHPEKQSVLPGMIFTMVSFAVLRAMSYEVFQRTGDLAPETFVTLCSHYCACAEGDLLPALYEKFSESPLYTVTRLQRLLWN